MVAQAGRGSRDAHLVRYLCGHTAGARQPRNRARQDASLNRSLIARSLLHESYYQVRYGQDSAEREHRRYVLRVAPAAKGRRSAARVHVALAADALRTADTATATSEDQRLPRKRTPTDLYVDLVAGEIALRAREGQAAVDAFERAMKKHDSARAQWGLARGYRVLGDREKAAAAAKATREAQPESRRGTRRGRGPADRRGSRSTRPTSFSRPQRASHPVEGATLESQRAPTSPRRSRSSRGSRNTGGASAPLAKCTRRESSSTRATPMRRSVRRGSFC